MIKRFENVEEITLFFQIPEENNLKTVRPSQP